MVSSSARSEHSTMLATALAEAKAVSRRELVAVSGAISVKSGVRFLSFNYSKRGFRCAI